MKPDTGRKSLFLPTPRALNAPVKGVPPSEYCYDIWCGKTRMVWLPGGEKDTLIRFDRIHEHKGRTDRLTDRRIPHDGISRLRQKCIVRGSIFSYRGAMQQIGVKFCMAVELYPGRDFSPFRGDIFGSPTGGKCLLDNLSSA